MWLFKIQTGPEARSECHYSADLKPTGALSARRSSLRHLPIYTSKGSTEGETDLFKKTRILAFVQSPFDTFLLYLQTKLYAYKSRNTLFHSLWRLYHNNGCRHAHCFLFY